MSPAASGYLCFRSAARFGFGRSAARLASSAVGLVLPDEYRYRETGLCAAIRKSCPSSRQLGSYGQKSRQVLIEIDVLPRPASRRPEYSSSSLYPEKLTSAWIGFGGAGQRSQKEFRKVNTQPPESMCYCPIITRAGRQKHMLLPR
jgi:hypothetical protein